jgi:type III secretion protein T
MEDFFKSPEALLQFGESMTAMLAMLALCTARLYVAFMVLPPLAADTLHGPLRNGICLLLGFYMAWGQPAHAFTGYTTATLLMLVGKEAFIGLLLGFAFSVVFWVAEGVGAMIDNMAGYNNVQLTNPQSGQQSTPVANLLAQLVSAGFFMLGGMLACLALLMQSFHWWPLHDMLPRLAGGPVDFVSVQMQGYLSAVAKIAAPVMLILVLIDLAIGLIARTADKLEPNNLGQPIKAAVATLMLALLVSAYFDESRPQIALRNLQEQLEGWATAASAPH